MDGAAAWIRGRRESGAGEDITELVRFVRRDVNVSCAASVRKMFKMLLRCAAVWEPGACWWMCSLLSIVNECFSDFSLGLCSVWCMRLLHPWRKEASRKLTAELHEHEKLTAFTQANLNISYSLMAYWEIPKLWCLWHLSAEVLSHFLSTKCDTGDDVHDSFVVCTIAKVIKE